MTKIITFIKPKGMKQYICCFLQHQILKVLKRINHVEYCYHVKQFILVSANSYCNFHALFIYSVLYFPLWTSTLYFPCFSSFFIDCNAGAVHSSSDLSLFRKRSIMGQLNVKVATTENEERHTLSKILYIAFQNAFSKKALH